MPPGALHMWYTCMTRVLRIMIFVVLSFMFVYLIARVLEFGEMGVKDGEGDKMGWMLG